MHYFHASLEAFKGYVFLIDRIGGWLACTGARKGPRHALLGFMSPFLCSRRSVNARTNFHNPILLPSRNIADSLNVYLPQFLTGTLRY